MFKCQYSGEISDAAQYEFVNSGENTSVVDKGRDRGQIVRVMVKPAEKPVRIVVKHRRKIYENVVEGVVNSSEGLEIDTELLVRAKYVEEIKNKNNI